MAASMVLVAFLVYVIESRINPTFPKPAAVNEPLKTYYLGNKSLQMPASWELHYISASFDLTDEKHSPQIKFSEKSNLENKDAAERLKECLNSVEKIAPLFHKNMEVLERTDLSEFFGWPAGLIAFKGDITFSDSEALKDEADPEAKRLAEALIYGGKDSADLKHLEISLFLAQPQGLLEFTYEERITWPADEEKSDIVADRQKILISWVGDFLSRYQWTGGNSAHQDSFLSTEYGRILIGDTLPELRYYLGASFLLGKTQDPMSLFSAIGISIFLNSHEDPAPSFYRPNRMVGGHPGEEYKLIRNANNFGEAFEIWKPNQVSVTLEWRDCSTESFSQENPAIGIHLRGYPDIKGDQALTQAMTAWDILLNSVRPVSANDLKE